MKYPTNFSNRTYQEIPRTSEQLAKLKITRTTLYECFEPCTFHTWVAKSPEFLHALEMSTTRKQRVALLENYAQRPVLTHPHEVRVRGHFMANPSWIAGGISALAMQGFAYFHQKQPAHMITPTSRGLSHHARQARCSTLKVPFTPLFHRDPLVPDLPIAPFPIVASQFLTSVAHQKHSWYAPELPRLSPIRLRIVQAADALCTFAKLTPDELLDQINHALPVSREVQYTVHKYATIGADSPPETWVRLLLKPLLPDLEVQVRISDADGHIATADLGSESTGLMIFYDGAYHSAVDQREWDTEVNARISALGLVPLRLSARSLRNPGLVLDRVRAIIGRHPRR